MQVSDDTRSSAIEISLGVALGDYTCTAIYHNDSLLAPSPATGTFTVQLESELNVNGIIYTYVSANNASCKRLCRSARCSDLCYYGGAVHFSMDWSECYVTDSGVGAYPVG